MSTARARALQAALRPLAAAAAPVAKGKRGEALRLPCEQTIFDFSEKRPAVRELDRRSSRSFHEGKSASNKGNCRKLHGVAAVSSEYTQADQAATAPWPIVRRSVLETLLKNYAHYPTVVQPLILHGPRGVGKRTVIQGLMKEWNKPPHVVAFVDLFSSERYPAWFVSDILEDCQNVSESREAEYKGEKEGSPNIGTIRYMVEEGLEHLASKAVEKGYLKSEDVLAVLLEQYSIVGALSQFLHTNGKDSASIETIISSGNTTDMWKEAMQQVRNQFFSEFGSDAMLNHPGSTQTPIHQSGQSGLHMLENPRSQVLVGEEAILSLALAQQLLKIHETWRTSSTEQLKKKGMVAKVSADAATSYAILLLRLISGSVQEGKFQSAHANIEAGFQYRLHSHYLSIVRQLLFIEAL